MLPPFQYPMISNIWFQVTQFNSQGISEGIPQQAFYKLENLTPSQRRSSLKYLSMLG